MKCYFAEPFILEYVSSYGMQLEFNVPLRLQPQFSFARNQGYNLAYIAAPEISFILFQLGDYCRIHPVCQDWLFGLALRLRFAGRRSARRKT